MSVEGMSCMHCVKTVTEALSEVPDVTEVREVSLQKGMAGFEGSPAPQLLVAAVKEPGYQAEARG